MFIHALLSVLVTLVPIYAYYGVDLSVLTQSADWECLVNERNVTYAIVRAYRNTGLVDSNSTNSLHYAAQAGVKDLGIYMFPCVTTSSYAVSKNIVCPSPEEQVLETVKYLRENHVFIKRNFPNSVDPTKIPKNAVVVNRVWIDIEDESPAKYYDVDPVKNQDFIGKIVAALEKLYIPVGIYTTKTYWQNIMGNIEGYGAKYPLWYPRYDAVDTLDFFTPFVDFTEVKIKQTGGDVGYCGLSQVDSDYREVESI